MLIKFRTVQGIAGLGKNSFSGWWEGGSDCGGRE